MDKRGKENKLLRRINYTYQRLTRDRHLWAVQLNLTDQEYRLWDFFIAAFDWDKTHKETYRTVTATDEEIGKLLGWSSSKVCRCRNGLISKGVISEIAEGWHDILIVPNGELGAANLQEQNANMQDEPAQLQRKNADLQESRGYNIGKSIVSYKDRNKDLDNGGGKELYEQASLQDFPQSSFPLIEDDIPWINESLRGLV